MSVSTRINSVVYNEGIKTTIVQSTKKLAVVLLNNDENIIATSALMSGDGSAAGGADAANATYLPLEFTFNADNKQLAVPTIAYTSTKSLVSANSNAPVAKGFAVVSFAGSLGEASEQAFEDAGKYYKFPAFIGVTSLGDVYESDDAVPLIVGTLSSEPIINANSNFRLTSTTITFAESSVA